MLGVNGFGELSLTQSYIAFILIFVGLNMDGAITRYYFRYGTRSVYIIFYTGMLYSFSVSFIAVIISILAGYHILAICFVCAFFQNLVNIQLTYRQVQKKVKSYLYIQFISSVLSVLFTIVIITYINDTFVGRVYAITSAFFITGLITFLFISHEFNFNSKKIVRHMKISFIFLVGFGGPLIFHNLSLFFKGQLDRLLVYNIYSSSELGIYSTSFMIASVLSVIFLALNRATLPYYYEALKNKSLTLKGLNKIIIFTVVIVPIPSFLAFLIPDFFYVLALGKGFGDVKDYTAIFLLGVSMTLPYFVVVNYLFYIGRTKIISIVSILSALLHVILLFSIGTMNLKLASLCLFITNLFTFISLYLYMNNKKTLAGLL